MQILGGDLGLYAMGGLALYAFLCPRLNYPFYRPLLFHPDRYVDAASSTAPELIGVKGCDVYFHGSMGQKLHGWFFRNPSARLTILFSHGNAGNLLNRLPTIEALLRCGASVFLYDYQGFGNSTGKPTVEGICDDAIAAHDHLVKSESVDPMSIVLYGESLGVGVSTYLSTMRPCSALILQSGFATLRKIAVQIFPFLYLYPTLLFPQPALDSLSVVSRKKVPLLLIHGLQDEVIGFAHAEEMFAAALEPKRFLRLPHTAHNNISSTAPDEFALAVKEFLQSIPSSAAA